MPDPARAPTRPPMAAPPAALARIAASVPPAITGPMTGMTPAMTPRPTRPPRPAPARAPVMAPVPAREPSSAVVASSISPSARRVATPIWSSRKPAWRSSLMAASAWRRSSKTPTTVERCSVVLAMGVSRCLYYAPSPCAQPVHSGCKLTDRPMVGADPRHAGQAGTGPAFMPAYQRGCWGRLGTETGDEAFAHGGREQAARQQDLTRKAVPQYPQDFVADVGLQSVDGQHHAALLAQEGMQPLAVDRGQSAQFVVAVQEVADRAQGDGDAAARQLSVDLGDAAMLGMPEASDQG